MNDSIKTVTHEHEQTHQESHTNSLAEQIVTFISGIVVLFLGLRFLLLFIGVNNTGIVNFVYQLTQPFVSPFYGIMGGTILYGSARIEWESLLAIIAVGIITYILVGLFRIISKSDPAH